MVYQRSFFTFLLTNALAFALVFSFVSGCKKKRRPRYVYLCIASGDLENHQHKC